jgi:hypothetical protein
VGGSTGPISLEIATKAEAPMMLSTNNTTRAIITPEGYVGIGTTGPASTLEVNGSVAAPIKVVDANYTLTDKDYTLILSKTTTDLTPTITVTFPEAATCPGRIYVVINNVSQSGGSSIIAQRFSSFNGISPELNPILGTAIPSATVSSNVTSNGTASVQISNQRSTWQSDGTRWWIIGL